MFAVPFDEIAPIVGRSPAATRQLASRARRRVSGAAGFVVAPRGRPVTVAGFTVAHGKIVEIDLLADPVRLRKLDLTVLDG